MRAGFEWGLVPPSPLDICSLDVHGSRVHEFKIVRFDLYEYLGGVLWVLPEALDEPDTAMDLSP